MNLRGEEQSPHQFCLIQSPSCRFTLWKLNAMCNIQYMYLLEMGKESLGDPGGHIHIACISNIPLHSVVLRFVWI